MTSGVRKACVFIAAYFGLLVLPKALPAVDGSGIYFVYWLSLPVSLVLLATGGAWGLIGLLRARLGATATTQTHTNLVLLAGIGLATFAVSMVLLRVLPRPLPSGSYLSKFDSLAWKAGDATDNSRGGAAPRQRMLGDVVDNVLPGKTRGELEALLGPSEDTFYFSGTGRDLIYPLGYERDTYMGIDSEWLLVWLDDSGHYQRHTIAND